MSLLPSLPSADRFGPVAGTAGLGGPVRNRSIQFDRSAVTVTGTRDQTRLTALAPAATGD
jgi:hypothetical protein